MKYIGDLIEDFNNGWSERIVNIFGDIETFFKVVDRRGKIDDIAIDSTEQAEYWENNLMLYFYEYHKDKFYYYCDKWLNDVEFENGKAYCVRSDASDFATLFCTGGRNDYSKETIGEILSGNYDFDWYFYDNIDVYDNVIEDLTPENLEILQERFVIELSGVEVSTETDLLEIIASEQGHNEYAIIDSSNIEKIIKDEKTVRYLLKYELDDEITNDLSKVYSYASHSALSSEYYDEVWGELTSDYFNGKPEYITRPHPNAQNKKVEYVRLEITDFDNIVTDFLSENKGYVGSSLLGYHGSILEVLKESVECLSVRFPDYPYVTPQLINEFFVDYF